MKEKHLVITKYRWDSRTKLNNEIKSFKKTAGIDCEIDMLYEDLGKPELDKNGRISREWFEENISREAKSKGYTHAKFVFSMADGNRWELKSGVQGSNQRDTDFFGESWMRCDEKSVWKYDDGNHRNKYVKVFLHEDGHEYKNQGFTDLLIHDYDYKRHINNLEGFYSTLKFSQKKKDITLLNRIVDMLGIAKNLLLSKEVTPLRAKYWDNVSQEYGVENSEYPLTGRHIGIDIPCPAGTPVYARQGGILIETGEGEDLGKYCVFQFVRKDQLYEERYLHLSEVKPKGVYRKGDVIGRTGNTGKSTGSHCHVDTWYNKVNIAIINADNWDKLTVDPKKI